MVWTKITKIENSKYNDSYLVYFDFNGHKKFSIVTPKVLNYLKIIRLNLGDKIFVIKTFNNDNKEMYLIKKVWIKK